MPFGAVFLFSLRCKNAFLHQIDFCTKKTLFLQGKMSHLINASLTFCVENVSVENLFLSKFPFFKRKKDPKTNQKS
jgi:hypothetical protein